MFIKIFVRLISFKSFFGVCIWGVGVGYSYLDVIN